MKAGETRNPDRTHWGKPLEGVSILAVEQMQALPYATQLLGHLGADVVKIEHPVHGESGRDSRPAVTDVDGREVGATYLRNNLSKRSIGIDLKDPEGRELVLRLAGHFDVLGENFKPGTMDRLGLGYDTLSARHPELVYLSVSGFGCGTDSPYRDWPAYAPIPEAMAGIYEMNRAGDEPPAPLVAGALGDIGSALFAVIGVLSALRHRERTGLGQHVDISMFDSMVAMADLLPFFWSMGTQPWRQGGGGQGLIEGYRCEDGWFVIEVIREHQFDRLADVVGHPEWKDDPRLFSRQGWDEHKESVIRPGIENWAAGRTKLEVCHDLCAAGVAAGPSNTAEDLLADPHVEMRNMLIEVERPDRQDGADPLLVVGNPVKLSRVAEGPVGRWPALGEHTEAILGSLLGLGPEEISDLRSRNVVS